MSLLDNIIYVVGAGFLLMTGIQFLQVVYTHVLPSINSLGRYTSPRKNTSQKPYAMVTGASDGIGFAFSNDLARRGLNLIIVSRNQTKLEGVKTKLLQTNPNIDIKILTIDAIEFTLESLAKTFELIKDLPVTILINNVGGFPPTDDVPKVLQPFATQDPKLMDGTFTMNARFMAHLTRLMMPQLTKFGPSVVLNISSGAQYGCPRLISYSGSKGFVSSFSKALNRENKVEGIPVDVINIVVGEVQSAANPGAVRIDMPSSSTYARAALNRVGKVAQMGWHETTPWIPHAIGISMVNAFAPEFVQRPMFMRVINNVIDTYEKKK